MVAMFNHPVVAYESLAWAAIVGLITDILLAKHRREPGQKYMNIEILSRGRGVVHGRYALSPRIERKGGQIPLPGGIVGDAKRLGRTLAS